MTRPNPTFSVNVDVTNPGQFFACCGLLELAHRLWPGAVGWFEPESPRFAVASETGGGGLDELFQALCGCGLSGLSDEDSAERKALELEQAKLKKQGRRLPPEKEARRKELGAQARQGVIRVGGPFTLLLNWWQTDDDAVASPKTWAGKQELRQVARAAQDALSGITDLESMFDHACVLRKPQKPCKKGRSQSGKVEPFYFDARRFVHALDTGFSLDTQGVETVAHPAVELLCLVGLQRFRPATSERWAFEYWSWSQPLSPPVAAAVVCGLAPSPGQRGYSFTLQFRDDQKRYKAFDFATLTRGGEPWQRTP